MLNFRVEEIKDRVDEKNMSILILLCNFYFFVRNGGLSTSNFCKIRDSIYELV